MKLISEPLKLRALKNTSRIYKNCIYKCSYLSEKKVYRIDNFGPYYDFNAFETLDGIKLSELKSFKLDYEKIYKNKNDIKEGDIVICKNAKSSKYLIEGNKYIVKGVKKRDFVYGKEFKYVDKIKVNNGKNSYYSFYRFEVPFKKEQRKYKLNYLNSGENITTNIRKFLNKTEMEKISYLYFIVSKIFNDLENCEYNIEDIDLEEIILRKGKYEELLLEDIHKYLDIEYLKKLL